jgi:membrane protein DedA with SNARE-associated domain
LDHAQLLEHAKQNRLVAQFFQIIQSDWAKAFGLGFVAMPLLLMLFLSCCTNIVRKKRNMVEEKDRERDLTPTGQRIVETLSKWNLTSIYLKITLLGELFFTLQVGVAKVTYLFLSWLNFDALADFSFYMCCGLVFLIGGTMFLLPPVPGLPVYVFAGILLGEKGRQDSNIGFIMAIIIASCVSLITKLAACVGQYMIGYYLGRSLKVQQLIGVDKVPTRAIEMILKTRGLNPGKVAILIGGPDWPTSVTCGIVQVNIPQMLLGTIPVLVLLVPCILAGACMGRVTPGEASEWNMMANAATALAAVVNMTGMAYAVWTISQCIQKHGEELARPRKEHEAIAELTRKEEAFNAFSNDVRAWRNISCFWKFVLLLATGGVYMSNAMFVILAEACFKPFAVSSRISDSYADNGLEGNVQNIVIFPVGHGALGLFFFAVLCHFFFVKSMSIRAHYDFEDMNEDPMTAKTSSKRRGKKGKKRRTQEIPQGRGSLTSGQSILSDEDEDAEVVGEASMRESMQ